MNKIFGITGLSLIFTLIINSLSGQIRTRFPSERKVITDPVTGMQLTFLTSIPAGDSKISRTHNYWTADGRWLAGDDFSRNIYLIDRHTHEMILLSTSHKTTAADHPHPAFNPDGTKIEIQLAMLSEDNKSMNICIIPVPEVWLRR